MRKTRSLFVRWQVVTVALIATALTAFALLGPQSERPLRAQESSPHDRQEVSWHREAPLERPVPIDAPPPSASPQVSQESAPRYTSLQDARSPWPQDGYETDYTFVQISDTHVGREDDGRVFERAVEAINRLEPRPRFVMITGDLTEGFMVPEVAEFKATLARLDVPVHVVPGNHDEGFDPRGRAIRFFNAHFPEHQTPYRFDEGEVAYIGIDSQLFNARRKSQEAANYAEIQWAKMEALMRQAHLDGKRIVLFHHIPFYPSWEPHRSVRPMWKTNHRDAYRELLERYHVEAELTGHFHRDEFYMEGGTWLLNAPPISQKFGRRPSYRLFRVTRQGLTYRQVYFLDDDGGDKSYQLDLHHVTDVARRRWLSNLPESDLRDLWLRRQAHDDDAAPWFEVMDREAWRHFALAPLDFEDGPQRRLRSELGAVAKMRRQKRGVEILESQME